MNAATTLTDLSETVEQGPTCPGNGCFRALGAREGLLRAIRAVRAWGANCVPFRRRSAPDPAHSSFGEPICRQLVKLYLANRKSADEALA
jgi:hypothetical protein